MSQQKRFETVQSNGKTLHIDVYEADTANPVIIFIPGMGCYAGIYEEFLSGLAGEGFTVIGVDLPGHGRSSGARGVFTFDEIMTAISDIVSYSIDRYHERVGLMGSSLGGTFALYAAMHEKRLKAVLCHDAMDISRDLPVPARFPRVIRFLTRLRFLADLMPRLPVPLRLLVNWSHVVESPLMLDSIIQDKNMVWYYSLGSWNSFLAYRPSGELGRISVPLKIIVGDRDLLFTPVHCKKIAERIGMSGAPVEVLKGGHALPLEKISRTIDVSRRWFKEKLRN
ncbi:MAG: alpha/beta hydrolase [Spirochaetes bacterium]|nr:MAG: alpha/beta hydrolase [Spirochaetota bacterium]